MSGIADLLLDNAMIAACSGHGLPAVINRMTNMLVASGPYAGGVLLEKLVAFGRRRLIILELCDAGEQRLRMKGNIKLKPDFAWKGNLSKIEIKVFRLCAALLAKRYGYSD